MRGFLRAATPFAELDQILDIGVHLHWTLPDGLTRASGSRGFPAVPDRWRIRRVVAGQSPQAAWVVESDFVETPVSGVANGQTLFPAEGAPEVGPPWRRRGRWFALPDWIADQSASGSDASQRSAPTAVGYGDPLFAAYYPSCRGLFGLYDPTPIDENAALTYEVLGWYSRHDEDILAQLPSLERLKCLSANKLSHLNRLAALP